MYPQHALAIILLLEGGADAADAADVLIQGQASSGNYIVHEESSSALTYHGPISISSNVPATIQQYNDDRFVYGEQPLQPHEAKVLVTSDCDATYTTQIDWADDSIDISVQGVLCPDILPFFQSSSYNASWSYESYWCERLAPPPPPNGESTRIEGGGAHALKSALRRILDKKTRKVQVQEEGARVRSSNVCTVNVEVMLDGCEHSLSVDAPKIRVLEGTPDNLQSTTNPDNDCVTDYEANIVFPGPPTLEGEGSLEVPTLEDEENWGVCSRPMPGRPFVDSAGNTLHASWFVAPTSPGEVNVQGWSAGNIDAHHRGEGNSTIHQNELGEAWIKNALGEHASVASFASFSIALMTNGAPSNLVEDALAAALDEVRHAKMSFDIASKLMGNEVGPGPLPASTHEFGHDLRALALAVAREGCVDETLSALEVAAEVDVIDSLLQNGAGEGSKYSGIGREVLAWMSDELRTIAIEESSHAALAWRTFRWVCSVDSTVCGTVKREVLSEDKLEGAFRRRFGALNGILLESWRKVYVYGNFDTQVSINDTIAGDEINAGSLVSAMADNVVHGIMSG